MKYYISLFHGAFNLTVFILLVSQGWLGLRIRRARLKQAPPPIPSIRRHRKNGPLFVVLGFIGFLVGLGLVLVSTKGRLVLFPAHFTVGLTIVILLAATYVLTRKIKRPDSPVRTPHFLLGLTILALYIVQAYLGITILF
jgi:heme A synthase